LQIDDEEEEENRDAGVHREGLGIRDREIRRENRLSVSIGCGARRS
jgi:hypothetical protein